ncbi:MAG: DUF5011 domain-containing protein, partial [Gammaproteobacteria bacterium]|nr:DUF5011 domain-containing protein [Gammaproteobacteria bacterium]
PTIGLTGGAVTLSVGEAYVEPGVSASDNVDGDLTTSIVLGGNLNVNAVGTYTVTYNVSDAAGNPAIEQTRSVSVTADTIAPIVTAPANIVVAATNTNGTAASNVTITNFLNNGTAIDAIDGPVAVSNDAPAVFPLGITTVIFSATDSAGNTGSAQATVTVSDQSAPTISLTGGAVTLSVGEAYVEPGVSASDNVDGNLTASIVVGGNLNVNAVGTYTVTYNVSDAAGNPAIEQTRSVSVTADTIAPIVTAPAGIVVAATDASGTAATDAAISSFLNAATANDAIDGPVAVSNDAPAVFPLGATTVTFSASDSAGNTGSAQATVAVSDQSAPEIELLGASSITLNVGDSFTDPGSTVRDNVDVGLTATVGGGVNTNQVGLYTLTYNVSDSAGNAAIQVTRSVSVQDGGAPVVTTPASIVVAATDASGTAATDAAISSFLNAATANDAVDGPVAVSNDAPAVFPLGATTVTFSASDSAGNTGSAQATVTVTDQSAPEITLQGASSITLNVGDSFIDPGSTVSDNVDVGLTATVGGSVNTNQVGLYTLTYNVSDSAGNAAIQLTRAISVQDSAAPVVTAPTSIVVAATDVSGTAATQTAISTFLDSANATDAVDGPVAVSNDAPAVFPLGVTTVTFSASDSAGNTGSAQATVTVTDQTAPVINLRGASSITLNVGDSFTDPGATASDNVDGELSSVISFGGSVNTSTAGLYTLTYNVSDTAGNAAVQVNRSVSVQDGDAPVVTAPASIIVAATNASGTAASNAAISSFLSAASALDAIDGPLTVSHNAAAVFPLGMTMVTFSATDSSNNTGSAQATVTVNDQTAPVIDLQGPSSITLNVGDNFNDPGTTVSDNVDSGLVATVSGSVNTAAVGLYSLTYNVSDTAGNPADPVTRTVSVQDSGAPVVSAPASIIVAAVNASGIDASDPTINSFLNAASATDTVDGVVAVTHSAPAIFPLGVTTVTFSASDSAGNTGSAQATVTVTDQTAPVITMQGLSTVNVEICDIYVDPGATVADNVDGDITASIVTVSDVDVNFVGSYSVTYNASDAAGNAATAVVRIVNVTPDVTPPVITMLGITPVNVLQGSTYVDAGATVSDNAEIIPDSSIVVSSDVNTSLVGSYTVTYDITDTAGNVAASVTRVVNVSASVNAPPMVTPPADIDTVAQGATTSVDLGSATAIDDLDGPVTATPDYPGPFVPGHHQVLWSATDSSGYTGYAIQFVDVVPLVEFAVDQLAEPGSTVRIRLLLNGDAVAYPVGVDYDVFDNAGQMIASGNTQISSGIDGYFDYAIPGNILSGNISFTMTTVSNAVTGPMGSHIVSLVNSNVEPVPGLEIMQNGKLTSTITTDGGPVSVKALVEDANSADTHSYDWSNTDNVLLAAGPGLLDAQFLIDPSGLLAGFNLIDVQVTDDGSPPLTAGVGLYLNVLNTAPVLTNQDSDGDGIEDDVEGFGDGDGDGIPDYLDAIDNPAVMPTRAGVFDKWLMNVQPGLELRLGSIALITGGQSASISQNDIVQYIGLLGGSVPANINDNHSNVGGYFDFEIHGLNQPGQSALVVIPQATTIPAAAVYRKYRVLGGWTGFVEDSKNGLLSALGEEGVCPAPGDPAYVPGLNQGHYCVQLLIEDGGPNDGDGRRNGVIVDPGGVAIAVPTSTNAPAASSSSGGGQIDAWLLLFNLLLLIGFRKSTLLNKHTHY